MKKSRTLLLTLFSILLQLSLSGQSYLMYIGTYTTWKEGGKGIYAYRFLPDSGKIVYAGLTHGIRNPSFLLADPSGQYLYAVNELGNRHGGVSSFSIERPGGKLTPLSTQPTGGDAPCHLTLDEAGTTLFTANYAGGSVSVFPVTEGRIWERTALITHEGHGPIAARQRGPHPHEVVINAVDHLLYVPDLGLDKVFLYRPRQAQQPLPAAQPYVTTAPGGGPRHLAFSPDGYEMYVVLEMASRLAHFHRDDPATPWQEIGSVSLLPEDADATGNTGAEVVITPDGKYLYASNRGHNSISLFSLERDGKPVMTGNYPCGGKTPRFFTLDPTGKYLLVLNQDSNNMVLFLRKNDGSLVPTGTDISVPKPVCAVFVPANL